jgi:REP element-mobilizing transposase RayT
MIQNQGQANISRQRTNFVIGFTLMRQRRMKVGGRDAVYHVMTRTVNGELLFKDREKELLRKMIWQVADFSGVEVLTYCIMENHFHVLVRVPLSSISFGQAVSDEELLRRFKVLYPKPTRHQVATVEVLERTLARGGEEAEVVRRRLLARMSDVSEFMKAVKQRFSVWYNRSHQRYGTLWAERFKSVLVEGEGNPMQTMAAYIDLNPVRAGIVEDPKDYRFCGYAEAVAGAQRAREGLLVVWRDRVGKDLKAALQSYRMLIFGKGSSPWTHNGKLIDEKKALKVLNEEDGLLPKPAALRCRIRYFSDGAILGSAEFVRGFADVWQAERGRKYPPKASKLKGADWGDLTTIQGLRKHVFG